MNRNAADKGNVMKAVVLHEFGNENQLVAERIPVPEIGDDDVLVKVEYAGVGRWDIFEREGGYTEMVGVKAEFPYVLGSEGSGTVVATGKNVKAFKIGDIVMGARFLNPKGGFYAEFAAIDQNFVTPLPKSLSIQEAGVIAGVGLTALRGLEDALHLKRNESIAILGASGGVGHIAAQLAKQMGARVFAVASGEDGVKMVKELGIENVVDGHRADLLAEAKRVEPAGFDAALLTAGGATAQSIVQTIKPDGRIAYPNGVYPLPSADEAVKLIGYNGEPDADILGRLHNYLQTGNVRAHIDQTFSLDDAQSAHLALTKHFVGKLALKIGSTIE
ncbi:zinc-binding alcohol dehydrogenase family protein [Planococcus sp. X10-3]|uniref:quinone oxidoreductase family protein n=1 Tax=Planococcus sp. X10-3 TaxID=3061240 RepID=UPI003BAE6058